MQAAILADSKKIVISDIPVPEINSNDVLIRVSTVTVCGSDHHIWLGEFGSRITYPHVLGHEFSGTVEAVGNRVNRIAVGQRVSVDPLLHCGVCTACIQGQTSACHHLKLLGVDMPGGLAEYVKCSEKSVYPLPDSVSLEHGAMTEVYSVACHCLRRGGIEPADTVAVFGAGKLGLCIIDTLFATGAVRVFAVDIDDFRLNLARKIGAETINSLETNPVDAIIDMTDGNCVDVAIEAVGHAQEIVGQPVPLAQSAVVVRNGGRMIVLGQGASPVELQIRPLVWKEISIYMSRVTRGEFPRALRLLESGRLHPDDIVTHRRPVEETADVFEEMNSGQPGMIKTQLYF